MTSYTISTDPSLLEPEKIQHWLKDCFWSKAIPLSYVKKFIRHSLCFGVYDLNQKQVGFGRVITDYTTYAYVCDVFIDIDHRKKGLGGMLVNAIMTHPELKGLKTWSLRTTEAARKIYEHHGFHVADHPNTQLEINDLDMYARLAASCAEEIS